MTVLLPARYQVPSPGWIGDRGRDVRGFDRREMVEIGGPGHGLSAPSDLYVTNGRMRFWSSGQGDHPYLNVEVFRSGAWRSVGCLYLAKFGSGVVLDRLRILEFHRDRAAIALGLTGTTGSPLPAFGQGEVVVRLHRGERILRVSHGNGTLTAPRYIGWHGGPPHTALLGCSIEPGGFGNALRVTSGIARYYWPHTALPSAWSLSHRWLPDAASGTQANSGILTIEDSAGAVVATLSYVASDRTVRWVQAGVTLTSVPLTFTAGQGIFIGLAFGSVGGRTLTTRVGSGTVGQVLNAGATGMGTTAERLGQLALSSVGGTTTFGVYGAGVYGAGPYGGASVSGGTGVNGLLDNLMVFADRISDTRMATLATATKALDKLGDPEADLVWYHPFDAPLLIPPASDLSSGLTYETTIDGGSTQAPDAHGLVRGLRSARDVNRGTGLSVQITGSLIDVGVFVATSDSQDTVGDVADQYLKPTYQRLRARRTT